MLCPFPYPFALLLSVQVCHNPAAMKLAGKEPDCRKSIFFGPWMGMGAAVFPRFVFFRKWPKLRASDRVCDKSGLRGDWPWRQNHD
jgi:hypothetical protein